MAKPLAAKRIYIVPTTHWDREWVMTFGQYQIRLGDTVDRVLDLLDLHEEYCFLLDGQSVVIEDYLEIRPEQRERLINYLRSGKLICGPWYVLADQFLQNGESTIRNLLKGMRQIREWGGRPMGVGYVPDSFGSIGALPMILQGFGIPYASFGRGRPYWNEALPHFEFWWEAQDGSKVLAANHGYGNAVYLSYPDIWSDIHHERAYKPDYAALIEKMEADVQQQLAHAATPYVYLSAGIDHMEPRETLLRLLERARGQDGAAESEFVLSGPEAYFHAVAEGAPAANLAVYNGEMRGSASEPIRLNGTLSSRLRLKQLNEEAELLLQQKLEPLYSFLHRSADGPYPKGVLERLWRLLMLNHPHDSICGCSLDQVHKDMETRFDDIMAAGRYLLKDGMQKLAGRMQTRHPYRDAVPIVVFNSLPYRKTAVLDSLIRVPRRLAGEAWALVDGEGKQYPARIEIKAVKQKDLESVYMTHEQLIAVLSKQDDESKPDDACFTVVHVRANLSDVTGIGPSVYYLVQEDEVIETAKPADEGWIRIASGSSIENEYLTVHLNSDGTFDLADKANSIRYSGLHAFRDRAELGDAYEHKDQEQLELEEYGAPAGEVQWHIGQVHEGCYRAETSFPISLPARYDWASGRRSLTTKTVQVDLAITVYSHSARIDIEAAVDNLCKDHMLRVAFPFGEKTDSIYAYDHFRVMKRAATSDHFWSDEPFQHAVYLKNESRGISLFSKGLPACQAKTAGGQTELQLTLLRCFGRLGPWAGADHPVPGGQNHGKHVYAYSLYPFGTDADGEIVREALNYAVDVIAESADPGASGRQLQENFSPIAIESEGEPPHLSCTKLAEDGSGIIFRLWNPGEKAAALISGLKCGESITVTDLQETPVCRLTSANGTVPVELPAFGLFTFKLHR
ncbi:alpha-mannosidase [Paenibacillus sp. GCM10027626]|uniref:alpha-mannosidase n=1 Tax=Paenibacillus sp. GCM10027626 TaxID=3273411 RepID=UPI00363603AE